MKKEVYDKDLRSMYL